MLCHYVCLFFFQNIHVLYQHITKKQSHLILLFQKAIQDNEKRRNPEPLPTQPSWGTTKSLPTSPRSPQPDLDRSLPAGRLFRKGMPKKSASTSQMPTELAQTGSCFIDIKVTNLILCEQQVNFCEENPLHKCLTLWEICDLCISSISVYHLFIYFCSASFYY